MPTCQVAAPLLNVSVLVPLPRGRQGRRRCSRSDCSSGGAGDSSDCGDSEYPSVNIHDVARIGSDRNACRLRRRWWRSVRPPVSFGVLPLKGTTLTIHWPATIRGAATAFAPLVAMQRAAAGDAHRARRHTHCRRHWSDRPRSRRCRPRPYRCRWPNRRIGPHVVKLQRAGFDIGAAAVGAAGRR